MWSASPEGFPLDGMLENTLRVIYLNSLFHLRQIQARKIRILRISSFLFDFTFVLFHFRSLSYSFSLRNRPLITTVRQSQQRQGVVIASFHLIAQAVNHQEASFSRRQPQSLLSKNPAIQLRCRFRLRILRAKENSAFCPTRTPPGTPGTPSDPLPPIRTENITKTTFFPAQDSLSHLSILYNYCPTRWLFIVKRGRYGGDSTHLAYLPCYL